MTEQQFKKQYIQRLKEVSPSQPERWYLYQANEAWERKKKQILKPAGSS